jgi:hypothetical protein
LLTIIYRNVSGNEAAGMISMSEIRRHFHTISKGYNHEYECLDYKLAVVVVPGGLIFKNIEYDNDEKQTSTTMLFVPCKDEEIKEWRKKIKL